MVFGLGSCRALTRTHLTVCLSPKLRPRIYLSSVMKYLSEAMACDAFGEERQKPQKRCRTSSGPSSNTKLKPIETRSRPVRSALTQGRGNRAVTSRNRFSRPLWFGGPMYNFKSNFNGREIDMLSFLNPA